MRKRFRHNARWQHKPVLWLESLETRQVLSGIPSLLPLPSSSLTSVAALLSPSVQTSPTTTATVAETNSTNATSSGASTISANIDLLGQSVSLNLPIPSMTSSTVTTPPAINLTANVGLGVGGATGSTPTISTAIGLSSNLIDGTQSSGLGVTVDAAATIGNTSQGSGLGVSLDTSANVGDSSQGSGLGVSLDTAATVGATSQGSGFGVTLDTATTVGDPGQGSGLGVTLDTGVSVGNSSQGSGLGVTVNTTATVGDPSQGSGLGVTVDTGASVGNSSQGSGLGVTVNTTTTVGDSGGSSTGSGSSGGSGGSIGGGVGIKTGPTQDTWLTVNVGSGNGGSGSGSSGTGGGSQGGGLIDLPGSGGQTTTSNNGGTVASTAGNQGILTSEYEAITQNQGIIAAAASTDLPVAGSTTQLTVGLRPALPNSGSGQDEGSPAAPGAGTAAETDDAADQLAAEQTSQVLADFKPASCEPFADFFPVSLDSLEATARESFDYLRDLGGNSSFTTATWLLTLAAGIVAFDESRRYLRAGTLVSAGISFSGGPALI